MKANALLFLTLAGVLASPVAGQLIVEVQDHRGAPVDDAVVTVFPMSDGGTSASLVESTAVMDQIDESFVPHVLVVPVGMAVRFPNHDDVRHHVYSFSEAKHFELPLYQGAPANPVVFDQPGSVVLGCNIHDWMRGYIYVTDAAIFALSVEGKASFPNLPAGEARVEIWHPRLRGKENWSGTATIVAGTPVEIKAEIRLKPAIKIRRAPKAGKKKY